MYRIRTLGWVPVIAALMVGCGPLKTLVVDQLRDCKDMASERSECTVPAVTDYEQALADRFAAMAWLAKVVYRDDLPAATRDARGCDYLDHANPRDADMPYAAEGRWRRWQPDAATRAAVPDLKPCFNDRGLYYETYVFENNDGVREEAVVAYRGTENRSLTQVYYDWSSNVAAALGFEPGQYALARQHMEPVIKALKRESDTIRVYAVGHSLGGGLAQQAGYLSVDIAEVFAFDASPVTNWSALRWDKAIEREYPIIHRVYHTGEILEKLRFVSTSFTRARFGRDDVGIVVADKSPIGGKEHNMDFLACHWAAMVAARERPPMTGKPMTGKPMTGKPMTGKPMTGKPEPGKPESGKPESGKPESGKPGPDHHFSPAFAARMFTPVADDAEALCAPIFLSDAWAR